MVWIGTKECRYCKNHRKKIERTNERKKNEEEIRSNGNVVHLYAVQCTPSNAPMGTKINIKDKHWAHSHWKWFAIEIDLVESIHPRLTTMRTIGIYVCINVLYVIAHSVTVGNGPFLNMHQEREKKYYIDDDNNNNKHFTIYNIFSSTYIYQIIETRTNDKHFNIANVCIQFQFNLIEVSSSIIRMRAIVYGVWFLG